MKFKKKTFTLVYAAILLAVILFSVLVLLNSHGRFRYISDSDYAIISRYKRLEEVRQTLTDEYYQELDDDALMLGAINGMTEAVGDPYTFYYTPEQLQQENDNDEGLYHGIGVLIQMSDDGCIEILRVYPNSPAERVGLQAGDTIIAVEGIAVSETDGRSYEESVQALRGEDNTEVTITVRRGKKTADVTLEHAVVNVSYADYELLEDNIGYISVSQFTGDAKDVFLEGLDYFKEQGIRGLVIDLRNNPGGYLYDVVDMADALLPEGTIVYTADRYGQRTDYTSDAEYYDVPLVVLVNGSSASASEIMAASIQTFGRGTILGTTTYGKGIVQTLISFESDNAGIQLTTAAYYTGDGVSIHGLGVTPDVELEFEGTSIPIVPDPENDNQLKAAIELLQ